MKFKNLISGVLNVIVATQALVAQTTTIDTALQSKAAEWVGSLKLNDDAKAQRLKIAIATHLTGVKDWHNSHPYTMIPEGINPTTGGKLSEMDRQIIICSTKPGSIHDNLMYVLKAELDSTQVEAVLDKYTIGKVDFTLKGYRAIKGCIATVTTTTLINFLSLFILTLFYF